MPDIIQLLPDHVANQIAAGEVIQRPASVVKELLENALDAGADDIKLIVKDAGKTLIQVIDNGCGMSHNDARMCLERHATSKISSAEDIFKVRTMGFRGEAMPSIAAVAHLEIKTRKASEDIGCILEVEGSEVKKHEAAQTPAGTSTSVKNLFFNIPARRKFLKSPPVEMRHIIDEFERVALPNFTVSFSLHHNGVELFNLPASNLRQRIVNVFNKNINQNLVPVEEETTILTISGFIGKPETARKTRGEQFLFVNKRFIKSGYLHNAITAAFEELIPKNFHPSYFLLLELDPAIIDINIHPTKTEVKFEDERAVYMIIRTAVKAALGKHNVTPTLDFEQESAFEIPYNRYKEDAVMPTITANPHYNPFEEEKRERKDREHFSRPVEAAPSAGGKLEWAKLYNDFERDLSSNIGFAPNVETEEEETAVQTTIFAHQDENEENKSRQHPYQLHKKYIITQIKSGFIVIHQQRAHERILYEQFVRSIALNKVQTQQLLFPQTVEVASKDLEMVEEMLPILQSFGFDIESLGHSGLAINGLPADLADQNGQRLLESMLEQYKNNQDFYKLDKRDNLIIAMAQNACIKVGQTLQTAEMNVLIDELFGCEIPNYTPTGKKIVSTITLDELDKSFE